MIKSIIQVRQDETNEVISEHEREWEDKAAMWSHVFDQNAHPFLHLHVVEVIELD